MSLGYADKLKRKKNVGGQLGAPEFFDGVEEVEEKMQKIVEWVRLDQPCIQRPCLMSLPAGSQFCMSHA